MSDEVRDPRTYAIIGAAMRVNRELGPGFLEAVYQEAMEIELKEQGIPHQSQIALPIQYRGHPLKTIYRADLFCYDTVIVELKATSGLTNVDTAQLINYLKATRHPTGLLLNFGTPSLQHRRTVFSS